MVDQESLARAVSLTARSRTYQPQLQAWAAVVAYCKPQRYLEIGAFEGRSALLFSSLVALSGQTEPVQLTSIDSWLGGDEHQQAGLPMDSIEATFDLVIQECRRWLHPQSSFEKIKALSKEALAGVRDRVGVYDLILIDAGHKAKDVLEDMVYAWPLLRPGGVMILDDYTWIPRHQVESFQLHSPKMGIDAFCSCYADELTILSNMPLLQLYLLKNPPSRNHYQALALTMPSVPPLYESVNLI